MIYESLASITINCTDKCNMDCSYCEFHDGKNELDIEKIQSIYKDTVTLQSNYIVIAGGEPLLHPEIMEIINEAKYYGLFTYLFTNGKNLTPQIIENLKSTGLVAIRLTLDSVNEEIQDKVKGKGAYAGIVNAINMLEDSGIGVNINVPITEYNISEIDDIVEFCIKNKIRSLRLSPLTSSSKEECEAVLKKIIETHRRFYQYIHYEDFAEFKDYGDFMKIIKKLNCPGGLISVNINPDGNITKCPYVTESFGNINEEKLLDVWMKNYEKTQLNNTACPIMNFDTVDLFRSLEKYFDKDDTDRCLSAWIAQLNGKKKTCFRDMPCWYFVFNSK
ncbi:radical SAM protein [Clostridiaceae bacterium M8S5]|nr:radical SAM protein [Clostridiaceae bacterium M8S5]